MFIGCVLVGVVLYLAQAILVPVALAVLLAFLLTPVVAALQRRIGRAPAVLATVIVTFLGLGVVGWIVTQQLASVVQELPSYRENIRQKVRDIRVVGKGGSVETLQKTVADIQTEMGGPASSGSAAKPVVVRSEPVSSLWSYPAAFAPFVGPLSTAALVLALVIFILLEREDLRNRLIRLFGHGRLVVTTKAFDEAGRRVSRYLLVQSFVNLVYAVGVAVGLFVFGVPYAILWAVLAGLLRFIPYVGPFIGAAVPVVIALAVLEGWTRPLLVFGLFVVLELFTNLVLEAVLYAGAIGVSQVALLIAVAFWSWLWGPLGLLLATPLTVCLVVLGKYVPGFEFVSTLMSDEPVLTTDLTYYQRLLAGDHAEASDLLDRHLAGDPETVYDAVMLAALSYAERDRMEGRLEPDEELSVIEATAELLNDMLDVSTPTPPKANEIPVLGLAADGAPDVLALRMLGCLLVDTPFALEIRERSVLSTEIVESVKAGRYRAVCIADIPPSAPSRSRALARRLRALAPDLPILVGRWAPAELADESDETLLAAGATSVAASLVDTRAQLTRVAAPPLAESRPNAA
jgi:predicted PurR-regulated permease PerM